ncbi:MAG: hypothetical protein R3B72_49535 [Polyangiaceae bacterium]
MLLDDIYGAASAIATSFVGAPHLYPTLAPECVPYAIDVIARQGRGVWFDDARRQQLNASVRESSGERTGLIAQLERMGRHWAELVKSGANTEFLAVQLAEVAVDLRGQLGQRFPSGGEGPSSGAENLHRIAWESFLEATAFVGTVAPDVGAPSAPQDWWWSPRYDAADLMRRALATGGRTATDFDGRRRRARRLADLADALLSNERGRDLVDAAGRWTVDAVG